MASSLIDQLALEACDKAVSVPDLLRKTLLVASKLEIPDVPDWVNKELSGYAADEVPAYRIAHGRVMARAPQGWLPVQFPSNGIETQVSEQRIGQSVAEIEALLSQPHDLQASFPPEAMVILQQMFQRRMEFCCFMNRATFSAILDQIRTAVLQWSIALDKAGVRGEGLAFSREEKKKAHGIVLNAQTIHLGVAQIGDSNTAQSTQVSPRT